MHMETNEAMDIFHEPKCMTETKSKRTRSHCAKWPGPGLEGKVKSFSVFNDRNGGEDDQTRNRKNLERC